MAGHDAVLQLGGDGCRWRLSASYIIILHHLHGVPKPVGLRRRARIEARLKPIVPRTRVRMTRLNLFCGDADQLPEIPKIQKWRVTRANPYDEAEVETGN
jgi:hypothetical protein